MSRRYGFTLILAVLLLLEVCTGIILANQEPPKPAYSSGIKTAGWRNPNSIQTHQNYSKVYVHNNPSNPSQYVITTAEKSERVYPVYNAHSYGQQPQQTQKIIERNPQTSKNITHVHGGHFANVVGGNLAGTQKNRTIYKRKIQYKTIEVYEKCPEGVTGSFVYYLSCNQFLNCWKGRGEVQNCAPGTLFNPKTLECDFPDKVECVTGRQNSLSLETSRSQKSVTQANCPDDFTGLIPNYTDCSKFINCNNGQQTSMDCPPGTLFDVAQNVCNFPYLTTCFNGQSESSQSGSDSGYQSQSQLGQYGQSQGQYQGNQYGYYQSHGHGSQSQGKQGGRQNSFSLDTSGSQKSVTQTNCPNDFTGSIPDYTDCSKFISCNNGQQTPMDCPPGTLFDVTKSLCNFPYLTTCFNGQSGASQSTGNSGYQSQSQLGQHHRQQQGQYQGHGYHQGQNVQGVHQYTGQSQGGQGGGQYHQTTSSQTSQGYPCDPLTQVCSYSSGQNQQGYGITQYDQHGQGSHYNQGQYYHSDSNSHFGQQNNTQHSIDSKLDFGGGGSTSYSDVPSNRGHRINIQTQHGTASCNPQTQNCGFTFDSSLHTNYGFPSAQNCNPQTQNCGQSSGSNQQVYGYSSTPSCDPRTQNCGTSYSNGYGQSFSQSGSSGQRQFFTPSCDPRIQNCGTNYGNIHQQSSGHSGYGSGSTQAYGSTQQCDPQDQRCIQNYGSNRGTTSTGYSRTRGSGQQNYHTVCNINDSNCQRNKTTVTKKSKEPKCPENYQGITKHPTDCKKFLNCANGRTFIQDCAPGTLFNPAIGNCDFPYNVDCTTNETDEATTEHYEPNTGSYWENTYLEHASQYGQNAGHGNIRVKYSTTPSYHTSQGAFDQGQTHHTHVQGQGTYSQGHNQNSQSHTIYDQSRPDQGLYNTGGVKTNQGSWTPSPGVVQPLTPRPTHVTSIPQETVINRGQIGLVTRPTHTQINTNNKRNNAQDYGDVFNPNDRNNLFVHSTTARSVGKWPPPFPSTDVNADYVFEYEDGEPVTLEPENVFRADNKKKKKADCGKGDFYCSGEMCISKSAVCDGHRDCQNGKDEVDCQEYLERFALSKNSQLNVLEDQRWINVSQATCALLCIRPTSFECRSFNYRKIDRTCFLSNLNVGLTGALRQYYPFDYYELKSSSIDCTLLFKCNNNKCITNHQLCDGFGDCADREDEKNCKAEDFGYSIKLAGSSKANEGRVEVTAFGKTGYICDDNFGIKDANVICRELGFQLGAAEVKGHSYYATHIKEKNTLYLIDDLDCLGNETTILDCSFPGWGVHNCRDQEIAGLVCKTPQEKCGKGSWKCDSGNECIPYSFVCDGLFDCTDDSDEGVQHCEAPTELRLANGTNNGEGRLEIKHHGIWGTICDDDFNEDAAKVVCRYFGFKGTATVKKEAFFGSGEGPIWLDQVSCYGNETELLKCTHWNWGEHNCDHTEDVGVICSNVVEQVQLQRHSKIEGYATPKALPPNTCGYRKDNQFLENDIIHARVVAGSVARKGDYPWQAALRIKGKAQQSHHWCGAVILSSQWVLTAAHCLLGYAKGAYMIVAGEYNTDTEEGTEQTKYIEEYFIHDNFTEGDRVMKNDIALIKVKGTGFLLSDDIQPICLPEETAEYERDLNCTISGFGSVKTGNSAYSHNLMAAWIPLIRTDICKMPHIYDTHMSEGMICAGFLSGGVDSCHGDSGGPLACLDNGLFTLYGITSWGHRCGFANKPGVYVKVAHYRKWIDQTIQENS